MRVQIESSMKQIESFLHLNFGLFSRIGDGPQDQFVERFRMKDDLKSASFNNTDYNKLP